MSTKMPDNCEGFCERSTKLDILRRPKMTHESDHKSIEDLVVSNTIQFDTLYRLLIEKRYFSEAEFNEKFKEVQADYLSRSGGLS
jgi:hypothetical protein